MSHRQPVIWLLVFTTCALLAGAGVVTAQWLRAQEHSHALARQDEARRMAQWQEAGRKEEAELIAKGEAIAPTRFGVRHATHLGHYSGKRYAILPPAPLAAMAVGDADVERSQLLVSVDRRQFTGLSDVQHPLWLRAGRFDPAFVLTMVLPLLLVAAAAPVLSGDRAGVLPLLVAQGAPLARVAAVRLLVRGGPVLLAALVSTAVMAVWGRPAEMAPGAHDGLRLIGLLAVVAIYGALWLALILWVDIHSRGAGTAMLTLAGVWLVFAIAVPALVHVAAVTLSPVSSRADLEEAIREAQQVVWSKGFEDRQARFFADHPDIDPAAVGGLERFMINQMLMVLEQDALTSSLEARDAAARARQARVVAMARVLSPVLLAQHAMEEAAGSGAGRRQHFTQQFDTYFLAWRAFFVPRIYDRRPISDLSTVPVFIYREEPWTSPLRRSALDLILLSAATMLLAAAGLRASDACGIAH